MKAQSAGDGKRMTTKTRKLLAAFRRQRAEREKTPAYQAMKATEARVGATPAAKLRWAVALVDRSFRGMTPGDWLNLRLEIEVFVRGGRADSEPYPGECETPSEEEAREIAKEFYRILEKVVARESVHLGTFKAEYELGWFGDRCNLFERPLNGWVPTAVKYLGHLVAEYGHLVRVCQAPALVADGGGICQTWFVADRPRRIYCSARCTSRATTKAYREAKRKEA